MAATAVEALLASNPALAQYDAIRIKRKPKVKPDLRPVKEVDPLVVQVVQIIEGARCGRCGGLRDAKNRCDHEREEDFQAKLTAIFEWLDEAGGGKAAGFAAMQGARRLILQYGMRERILNDGRTLMAVTMSELARKAGIQGGGYRKPSNSVAEDLPL